MSAHPRLTVMTAIPFQSHLFSHLMPGGYMPRLEIMERECWKFLDWRLNSDNDPRLHGQPSSSMMCPQETSWRHLCLHANEREDAAVRLPRARTRYVHLGIVL